MFIVSDPICPNCSKCILSRAFTVSERVVIAICILLIITIPVALWVYFTPRRLSCRSCELELTEGLSGVSPFFKLLLVLTLTTG